MYTDEMLESIKKVEAKRAENAAVEPRRMTADEKDKLLETYHPDYITDQFDTIKIGPNKGEKAPLELVQLLQGKSRINPSEIKLDRVDYDVDVLIIGGGGAGSSAAIEAHKAGANVMIVTKLRIGDANTMMEKMYGRDDSPYIDYEGGYYYNYGDHYYPDGARSEGLVAAYYLADFLGEEKLAQKLLAACKKAAKSQFSLFNCEENNYSHKNQARSLYSIRFKATRQWIRVDSIQHVACFFARLYKAEN